MDKYIKQSYNKVLNDTSFVKLTVFSLLPYSMLFVGYLFYQTYFFINSFKEGFHFYELKVYIDKVFSYGEAFFWPFILVIVFGLIFYFFFPPIAESALITYLDKGKSVSSSLGKGLVKFFPMFELHGFLSLFSFLFFFIAISRLYVVNMLNNFMVISFLGIWLFFILFFNFSSVYAKYLVTLENYSAFDAIKESIKLSFLNIKITLKYFFLYILLYFRVLVNILIIIGIPLLLLYLFLKINISHFEVVKYFIFFIMGLMFFLTAYINGIIEAFFISMWYNVFKQIEKE